MKSKNCKNLSVLITKIKEEIDLFQHLMLEKIIDISALEDQTKKIERLIEEAEPYTDIPRFFKKIESSADQIKEKFDREPQSNQSYEIDEILNDFEFHGPVSKTEIDQVLQWLTSSSSPALSKLFVHVDKTDNHASRLYKQKFLSMMVEKLSKFSQIVEINREYPDFKEYIGAFLNEGTLKLSLDSKHDSLGYYMDGGNIIANATQDFCGKSMKSGVIRVKNANNFLGSLATGGTIIAEKAGKFCQSNGATIILGRADSINTFTTEGTIFLGDPSNLKDVSPNIRYYYYDDKRKEYFHTKDRPREIIHPSDIIWYKELLSKKSGLVVFHNTGNESNITDRIAGGILVLDKLPKQDLGKGLIDGVIIIEDASVTPEEAQKAITWENRKGGVIMMRVPDTEKPGQTKLIDLETPEENNNEL